MIHTIPGRAGSYELFTDILKTIVGGRIHSKSMIDLCCNEATVTNTLRFKEKVYVDIEPRTIPEQDRFVQADVLGDHPALMSHYDVSMCLDGIEHLPKSDGFRLLDRMAAISDLQILFTPLGDYMVEAETSARWTDPTSHKCGWRPEDLPGWAHVVLPEYHPTLNVGAFFFWRGPLDLGADFTRVVEAVSKL